MSSTSNGEQSDVATSLAVIELEEEVNIIALCQDHKLRMWSFMEQTCIFETDMLAHMPSSDPGHCHRLRLAGSPTSGIYVAIQQSVRFTVFQLVAAGSNRYSVKHISSLFTTQETLDFSLTPNTIRGVWRDNHNWF
ncbi:nuclear pore complex protein Nup160-like [Etheostoma cragini]|uniref:nuclear pore complex protein Nup160-like n=1 Tax=Etheostoma cragini TaxID=417921 RepID=UPI00155E4EE3|nr:nuclear pore complex protein Nup160-like [Etheostoma cragini]